jgi:signal transduction histidine kinase
VAEIFTTGPITTAIIGLLLLSFITRRFCRLTAFVGDLERGDFSKRIELDPNDEISELGRVMNNMADTIVANIDALKEKDELRRELISNVSHDLRGPLASIGGYTEILLSKKDSLPESNKAEALTGIQQNVNFLDNLIGDLFELSKFEAKQLEPKMEDFSLDELVRSAIQTQRSRADKKKLAVQFKAADSESLVMPTPA